MAWSAIADIYKKMGNRQLEAETYINLFKINPNAHSGKLKTAGEAYEELGMTEKAKDAYSLFIDRRFSNPDVAMNLARIYFNEKNCRKLPDVLKGYDTIPEAAQMLNECGFSTRKIKAEHTLQKKKLSPLMFSLRYGGLAIMAGGTVGGIVCNSIADTEMKRYNEWKDDLESDATKPSEVKKMRETIDSNVLMRNVLYGVAAVGLSAFAVTWFF
jgi:tetratricopeptide (TPR) repeat protein